MASGRRKRDDSVEGPSKKRKSRDPDESEEEEEVQGAKLSQFEPAELRTINSKSSCTGVVDRLYMRNFMCHAALEVTFNRRVNFVVGRNGSGKSAILLALVVGLGGKASATNRGNCLADFVKKGEKSAVVEVTLNNSGMFPYKRDIYGGHITVVRTITAGTGASSGYKIKSASGAVVSTKRADVDRMLAAMKIQVDNPISILNQDTSRNFLNSSDPKAKYALFMRATQMDVVASEHANAILIRRQALTTWKTKREMMLQQEQTVQALRARFKALKSVPKQRQRIETLENEIAWAQAVEKEAELAEAEEVVAAEEAKMAGFQREVDGQGRQEAEMKQRHRDLTQELAGLQEQLAAMEDRWTAAKALHVGRREETQAANREKRTLASRAERQQGNAAALRDEIARLEQSTGRDYAARRQAQKAHIQRAEEQLAQAQAALATSALHVSQLRATEAPVCDEIHALRAEAKEAERRQARLEREIQGLEKDSSSNLAVFGNHAVPLERLIDAAFARGEFKRRPVGPLGRHVRLRTADASWSNAIEQLLGGLLATYAVDSSQDRIRLLHLMGEVLGNQRKPAVINSRFMGVKHDTSPRRVAACPGSIPLLDALLVDDAEAFNTLVDQAGIESVLLIESQEEAFRIMSSAQRVPRNCAKGLLRNGDSYFPDPDYRTYAGRGQYRSRYLQVSAQDRVKQLQAEQRQAHESNVEHLVRMREREATLHQVRDEMTRARQEHLRLERTLNKLRTEIAALRDAEEPEVTSISTLAGELAECLETLETLGTEETLAAERLAVATAALEESKAAADELRREAKELGDRDQPLVAEMEQIRSDLKASLTEQKFRATRLREQVVRLAESQRAAQGLQEQATALADNATKLAPRLEPQGSSAELNDERRQLEAALRGLEEHAGNYIQVGEEYHQVKDKYNHMFKLVTQSKEIWDKLGGMIKIRAKYYEQIRRLVSMVVTTYFHLRLSQRKYTGDLLIDHVDGTLKIEVAPPHRGQGDLCKDTRTLSGGERSYSTVVFIMALWDTVELPFYFMDEFDVFMDNVNRKVIMKLLMDHAKQKQGRQFVFLTPQDVESVATDQDVAIHRMEDPRG